MVSLKNLEIGDKFKRVTCGCGKHPLVTEYIENLYHWTIKYKCVCGNSGSFGMGKPPRTGIPTKE